MTTEERFERIEADLAQVARVHVIQAEVQAHQTEVITLLADRMANLTEKMGDLTGKLGELTERTDAVIAVVERYLSERGNGKSGS
jgi:uncharacterized coiled-coil protein SlyX